MRGGLRLVLACVVAVACASCSSDDGSTTESSTSTADIVTPQLPTAITTEGAPSTPLARLRTATVDVDSPDWTAQLDGSLWVRLDSGHVVRVDPETAEVLADVRPSGASSFASCQAFGVSTDAVWACGKSLAQRIDPATNRVDETFDLDVSHLQGHAVFADDSMWLLAADGQSLIPIDSRTNEVGTPLPLDVACTDLAGSGVTVWAVCPWDEQVLAVDVRTGAVTHRLGLVGAAGIAVGDYLWVGAAAGLVQLDPGDESVEAVYDLGDVKALDVAEGAHATWVRTGWSRTGRGPTFLVGIDPAAHQVTSMVTAPDLLSGGTVQEIDGQIWTSAYDDGVLVRMDVPGR